MEKNLTKFHLSVDFLFLFQSKKKKRSLNKDLSDFMKDFFDVSVSIKILLAGLG
jgi:hypothetical protein